MRCPHCPSMVPSGAGCHVGVRSSPSLYSRVTLGRFRLTVSCCCCYFRRCLYMYAVGGIHFITGRRGIICPM